MEISYRGIEPTHSHEHELLEYRTAVRTVLDTRDCTKPESALATFADELMHSGVLRVTEKFTDLSDVVLVGIGGSSLGTEALHAALRTADSPRLHVLDTVSDTAMSELLTLLETVAIDRLAIVLISKSGGTTETLANAEVLLDVLRKRHGDRIYDRVLAVGNGGSALLTRAEVYGAAGLPMHEHIGGRYSVFTSVGLVPLRLLGYDIDALLDGVRASVSDEGNDRAGEAALMLYAALETGVRSINYFTFDTRLAKLGFWYRQLSAESLGKEIDRAGKKVTLGFIPTVSTPVDLHSIGQLYFSGFAGVLTDFIGVADTPVSHRLPDEPFFARALADKSLAEIAYAIEGGVVAAYDERTLPYRRTILPKVNERSLGEYMGLRMLETMYLAHLLNVNAFDQPNVELYKEKTRDILNGK